MYQLTMINSMMFGLRVAMYQLTMINSVMRRYGHVLRRALKFEDKCQGRK